MKRFLCAVVASIAAALPMFLCGPTFAAELSYPPMRPLPVVASGPLAEGRALYVDAMKGGDEEDGARERPERGKRMEDWSEVFIDDDGKSFRTSLRAQRRSAE